MHTPVKALPYNSRSGEMNEVESNTPKAKCLELVQEYHITPGISFGSAPVNAQSNYTKLSCDSFLVLVKKPPLDAIQVNESLQMIMAENYKFSSSVIFRQGSSGSISCEENQISSYGEVQMKVLIVVYQEMRTFHIAVKYIKLNIVNVLLSINVGVNLALCFRSSEHYERDLEYIYQALNQYDVMKYVILIKFTSIADEERIVRTLNRSIKNNVARNPVVPLLRQYAQRYLVGQEIRNLISSQVLLGESIRLVFLLRSDVIISYLQVQDFFPVENSAVVWVPLEENNGGVNDRIAVFSYCGFVMYASKLLNATVSYLENGGVIHGESLHRFVLSSNAPLEVRRVPTCYGVFRKVQCQWTRYGDQDCRRASRSATRDEIILTSDGLCDEWLSFAEVIYKIQSDCEKKVVYTSAHPYGFGSMLNAFMMQAVFVWIHGMRVEFTPVESSDSQKALYDPQFCKSISNNTLHCIFQSLVKQCESNVHNDSHNFLGKFDKYQYIKAYEKQTLFHEKLSTPIFWAKVFNYLYSPRTEFQDKILSIESVIKASVPKGQFVCVHMRGAEKSVEAKVYSFHVYVNATLTLIQPSEYIFLVAENRTEEHLFEQSVGDFRVFKYLNASQRFEGSPSVHMADMYGQLRHCAEARVIICTLSSNIGRLLVHLSNHHVKSPKIFSIDGKSTFGLIDLENFYPT